MGCTKSPMKLRESACGESSWTKSTQSGWEWPVSHGKSCAMNSQRPLLMRHFIPTQVRKLKNGNYTEQKQILNKILTLNNSNAYWDTWPQVCIQWTDFAYILHTFNNNSSVCIYGNINDTKHSVLGSCMFKILNTVDSFRIKRCLMLLYSRFLWRDFDIVKFDRVFLAIYFIFVEIFELEILSRNFFAKYIK